MPWMKDAEHVCPGQIKGIHEHMPCQGKVFWKDENGKSRWINRILLAAEYPAQFCKYVVKHMQTPSQSCKVTEESKEPRKLIPSVYLIAYDDQGRILTGIEPKGAIRAGDLSPPGGRQKEKENPLVGILRMTKDEFGFELGKDWIQAIKKSKPLDTPNFAR